MIFPSDYKSVGVTRTDPAGRIGCPIYFSTEYLISDLPSGYSIYKTKSEGEGLLRKLVSLELISRGKEIKKFKEKLDAHDRTRLIESAIPLCKGSVNTVIFEGMDRHITFVNEPSLHEVMEIEIIDIMKERENICRYLDIPFQHISDKVLQKMRRGHSKQQNYELIDLIRKQIPGIALRTTLLTGHPGEGKKEFAELCDFVKDVKFDRLGVFTYSEEEDTWAAGNYKDTLSERLKKDRADELMTIQQDISKKLNDKKLGKSIKVLIDSREGEYYVGRSEADSPEVDNEVLIPVAGNELEIGMFYNVRITRTEDFDLFGEVVEKV